MNHVNSKLLIGLACAALFAIVSSAWLGYAKQAEQQVENNGLMPELVDHINEVKSVTIVGAENKPLVSLNNGSNGWTVQEKADFPADTGKLRGLLLNLANAKLLQSKTSKPEHYAELGVEDLASKDAQGLMIDLQGLAQPAKLIIGQTSKHGGSFVRKPDQAQSWLSSTQLTVESDPQHWLNTQLTDIAAQRITEVVLTSADGKTLRLSKDKAADSNFQLADLPAGRELTDPAVANSLASALSGLQLEQVMPATAIPQTATKARYRSFEGLIVEASLWQQDGLNLAQLTASAEATVTDKAIQTEVDQLQHRLQGRQFAIAAAKYANMTKTQAELLKPLANKSEPAKPAATQKSK